MKKCASRTRRVQCYESDFPLLVSNAPKCKTGDGTNGYCLPGIGTDIVVSRPSGRSGFRQSHLLHLDDAGCARFQRFRRSGPRLRNVLSSLTGRGLQQLLDVSRDHLQIGHQLVAGGHVTFYLHYSF